MATEAAKLIDKLRAQTAEWANTPGRNRGLWSIPVRSQPACSGPAPSGIVALLNAITHDNWRAENLRARVAAGTN